jgi:AcrR family transcriptional regulator
LLTATRESLERRSLMDLSVAEIARVAGTSPATFYHYFKDVESAVLRLAQDIAGELPEAVDGNWTGGAGLERARALVNAFIAHWDRHRAVLLVRNLAADKGDPRFQLARRAALLPVMRRLASLVELAVAEGRVDSAIHPDVASASLVSVLERLSAHSHDLEQLDVTHDAIVETAARIVCQTLGEPTD